MGGFSKGSAQISELADENCETLDSRNKETREDKHVQKVIEKKQEKGEEVTVAAAAISPGCSKLNAQEIAGSSISGELRRMKLSVKDRKKAIQFKDGIALAPTAKEIKGSKKNTTKGVYFCNNLKEHKPYDCDSTTKQFRACTGHAETAILTTLGKAGCLNSVKQILFNINWPNPGKESMPCPNCYELMKKVAESCDIAIYICDKSNDPKSIRYSEEEGGGFKSYEQLEEDITLTTKRTAPHD